LAKISRMTVRQAIGELVKEGVLYTIKGKGTFITRSKIEQNNIMSFSELVKSKGLTPVTEIINFEKGYKSFDIAKLMDIKEDTLFYRIKRLRKADKEPIAIEEVFIPENYCPCLEKYDLRQSLYEILLNEYQYKIERINLTIDAAIPDEKEQELLEIGKGIPLIKVKGKSIANLGIELLYERSCYRSDKFSYKVSIFNRQDY